MGRIVEKHVNAISLRWFCDCGGEYAHIQGAYVDKVIQHGPRPYKGMMFPHQCTECKIIQENRYVYPRLVAEGELIST